METPTEAKLVDKATGKTGNILAPIILTALSFGATHLLKYLPEAQPFVTEENLNTLAGFLATALVAGWSAWGNMKLRGGTLNLQKIINKVLPPAEQIEEDGIAGPETLGGAEKATGQ